jgi:hypothetical protein
MPEFSLEIPVFFDEEITAFDVWFYSQSPTPTEWVMIIGGFALAIICLCHYINGRRNEKKTKTDH